MKTANRLLLVSVFSALSATATAADSTPGAGGAPVDTSKWKCSLCKFEEGLSGSVDVGAGYVSNSSAKFGDYTGLNRNGGYFVGDGSARYRGANGVYWNVDALNLGLDSRSVNIDGGRQGEYKLFLNYDELPNYISDTVYTPFLGSGGPSLILPGGWPPGGAPTTAQMPLAGTLYNYDLETKRKTWGAGASMTPGGGGWEYSVSYRHQTQDGAKRTSGAFFTNAAQLVLPVDYTTDQIDASVSYTGARLQAKFAYYGSKFSNGNDALNWQNPYTPLFGATAGQLALPPDNQFHQLIASVGYQLTDRTRVSADIAYGRMTQDQNFLAPTVNPLVAAPALPATNLNGQADTLNANVKLTSAITDEFRVTAAYTYDNRDNTTPQAVYPWVTTDMFVAAPRINTPYSFTQERLKLGGEYKFSPTLRAAFGYDYDGNKRTWQEVSSTNDNIFWGKVSQRAFDYVDVSLKLAYSDRNYSVYQTTLPWVVPAENPLMRKFNMVGRTRESAQLRADIAATETVNVGIGAEWSNDQYKDSTIGLTSGKLFGLNGDVSAMLTEATSLHAFANYQKIDSSQAGSQTFSGPDWWAQNQDTIYMIGFGAKHVAIKDKLDLGADYAQIYTRSAIDITTGPTVPQYPDRTTSLKSFKLYANYHLKENMSLQAGYWYENYNSYNWMLDGILPATIPNVLSFGEQSPRYHVNVVRLALRYKF